MSRGKDVNLEIGGDASGLDSELVKAREAVVGAVASMRESLGTLSESFGKINQLFVGFTALLAGGEAFKEAINASAGLTYASVEMGRQLGISATEASVLRGALNATFISQEQFTGAAGRIARTLATNEQAFRELGVQTRDSNGNFRSTTEIMLDVNDALAKFKEGTDRNVEGVKIYGRGWLQNVDILRLNRAAMEEARERAEALGLTVGQNGVAQTLAYKSAMVEVHEVLDGVLKVIGDALLPVLTSLGQWFASVGPTAVRETRAVLEAFGAVISNVWAAVVELWHGLVEAFTAIARTVGTTFGDDGSIATGFDFFNNVLRVVVGSVQFLRASFSIAVEAIVGVVEYLANWLYRLSDVAAHALSLDWQGTVNAWREGGQRIEDDLRKRFANLSRITSEFASDLQDTLTRDVGVKPADKPVADVSGGAAGTAQGDPRALQKWEAELEAAKAAYQEQQRLAGSFQEYSKEQEVAYWQKILATQSVSQDESVQIKTKISKLLLDIDKRNFEGELETIKAQEKAAGANYDRRLELARQYAAKVGVAYGLESKEYAAAQGEIVQIEREKAAAIRQIREQAIDTTRNAALAEVANAEGVARFEVELGSKNKAQLLAQEQGFERKRYEIQRQALVDKLALLAEDPTINPAKIAEIQGQILELETTHNVRLAELARQTTLQQARYWRDMFRGIESGFQSVFTNFLNRTATLSQTVRSLFQSVANAVIGAIAKMAAEWVTQHIVMLVANKAFALGTVSAHAGAAGAAGVASFAGAPWPIDLGAPAFGAAMSGAAAAFGATVSAAGGYDIPAGVNPKVQAHAREMILPAKLADTIRGLAAGGGGGAGGDTYHVAISALDAGSLRTYLRNPNNAKEFGEMLRRQVRNFALAAG